MKDSQDQQNECYPEIPDVEVLICTHNRVELLKKTLKSLNECKSPAKCSLGIFVVANACTDETSVYLEAYQRTFYGKPSGDWELKNRLPLRWMADPVPGKSHALNQSLPHARGRVIAFVDDDHRVDVGYLEAIFEASSSYPQADLFCGRIHPDWDGNEPDWVHDEGPYRIYPLPVPRFDLGQQPKHVDTKVAIPGGGNLATRQGVFEQAGPYLLELGPQGHNLGGAEDIEWVQRAVSGGAQLHYIPDMVQYHYVEPARLTLSYIMRKAYERSASTTRLGTKYQGRFRVPPYMLRKVLSYLGAVVTSFDTRRRRFYLTRLAAALGEIKGMLLQRKMKNSPLPGNSKAE